MKIFTNITSYSGFSFSFTERRWVENPIKYDMSIFTENIEKKLPFGGGLFYRYSDFYSMLILYGDIIFFMILTWYFDHVISSNRGRGEPIYYPLNKILKFFRSKREKESTIAEDDNSSGYDGFSLTEEEESAIRERNKVYNNSKAKFPALGMRIKNLSKTFKGFLSKKKV